MIFGEHPREFIVSESCLDFLHHFFMDYFSPEKNDTKSILTHFDIYILPLINPDGKVILENSGNFCYRWNANKVDLNRNFGWEFGGKGSTHREGTEEWHGEKAFSEKESSLIRWLVEKHKFQVVLDIHSGTQQLFIPFVDSQSRKMRYNRGRKETAEEFNLIEFIQKNSKRWFVNSGIAWKENDYGADGTILDWIGGGANVSYSVCAEIYGDPNVDNSIDCFVQFNPKNGVPFTNSLESIRSLYTGTFQYFMEGQPFPKMFTSRLLKTVGAMRDYLL